MYAHFNRKPEDTIDRLLAAGNISDAEVCLDEQFAKGAPTEKERHHLSLKKAALPLYEIAYGSNDSRAYNEANDTYGEVGELLRHQLRLTRSKLGHISEQTFLALHTSELIDTATPTVMLPAPRTHDIKGVDFYLSPIGTETVIDGWAIQVKTRATQSDVRRYSGRAALISMLELDPHANDPRHEHSLASTVLRQLDGIEKGGDRRRLTAAREKTYEYVRDTPIVRPTAKALFQTARRLEMFEQSRTQSLAS